MILKPNEEWLIAICQLLFAVISRSAFVTSRFRLRRRCERSIAHYFSPLLSEQGEFAGP